MTNPFQRLLRRYFGKQPAPFRRTRILLVEALEDRFCPAAVDYMAASHTLHIVGDRADNVIQVQAVRPHEVQVVGDGVDFGTFSRVEHVEIQTGDGNDTVDIRFSAAAALHSFQVDTGAGNDRLSVDIGDADPPGSMPTGQRSGEVDPPQPDMPAEFHIDAGAGSDVIDFRAVEGLPLIRAIDIDAGAGNDLVNVNLAGHPDLMRIDLGAGNDRLSVDIGDADPPGSMPTGQRSGAVEPPQPDMPAEFHIDAGAGNDLLNVNLAGHPDLMRIDLGAGNDRLSVNIGDADPPGSMPTGQRTFAVFIDAGAGNDVVDYNVAAFWGLHSIDLGAGNDRLSVNVGDADPPGSMPMDQMPEVRIVGGAGDDVVGVHIPHTRALIDIDLGPGDDVLRVEVGDPTHLDGGGR